MVKSIKTNQKFCYFLFFTVISLAAMGIGFCIFKINGRTLIWAQDGVEEFIPKTLFLADWVRDLFHGKVRLYDFTLGMGSDAITYNSIWFYDPLNLLFLLGGEAQYEALFAVGMLLRFYLVGVSAYVTLTHWGRRGMPVVAGSLAYEFCGYTLAKVMNHPNFYLPMLLFPLMLITMERLVEKKGWRAYVFVTALMAITSLYFFYMCAIFLALYYMVRYRYQEHFLLNMLRVAAYSLLAGAIAGILLLPNVLTILSSSRSGKMALPTEHWWIFERLRYILMLFRFITPGWSAQYDLHLGLAAIVLLALILYLVKKRENTGKILGILLLVIASVPFLNYVMSVFGYVSGRWSFAIELLAAFILCEVYEEFLQLSYVQLALMTVVVTLYDVGSFLVLKNRFYGLAAIMLTGNLCLLWMMKLFLAKRKVLKSLVLNLLLLGNIFGTMFFYLPQVSDFLTEYSRQGEAMDQVYDEPISAVLDQMELSDEQAFGRIGRLDNREISASLPSRYYGVVGYNNVASSYTNEFYDRLGLAHNAINKQPGLNQRSILESLAGVKDYVMEYTDDASLELASARVPVGFGLWKKVAIGDKNYALYQNEYALPLGIAFDSYVNAGDLEGWNPIQIQNLMQSAVILNDSEGLEALEDLEALEGLETQENPEALENMQARKLFPARVEIPITRMEYENCVYDFDSKLLKAEADQAKITFSFEPLADCEYYLYLDGVDLTPYQAYSTMVLQARSEVRASNVGLRSDAYPRSVRQRQFALHLGYSEQGLDTCTLTISKKGDLNLGNIRILCQPMQQYRDNMDKLAANGLQDVKIDGTSVRGRIYADGDRILLLSIPYSKGWTALVDGVGAKVLRANYDSLAIALTEGNHEIVLNYRTPGLLTGACLSVAGWICFIILCQWDRKQRKTVHVVRKKNTLSRETKRVIFKED